MIPTSTPSTNLPNKSYILPEVISMWPPVWWTWFFLAVIVITITLLIFVSVKKYKKKRYRREALIKLKNAYIGLDDKDLITVCQELIRRCLVSENKLSIAALPSQLLINHLDKSLPRKQRFKQLGNIFINGPHRGDIHLNSDQKVQILNLTHYWIKKHNV